MNASLIQGRYIRRIQCAAIQLDARTPRTTHNAPSVTSASANLFLNAQTMAGHGKRTGRTHYSPGKRVPAAPGTGQRGAHREPGRGNQVEGCTPGTRQREPGGGCTLRAQVGLKQVSWVRQGVKQLKGRGGGKANELGLFGGEAP